MKHVYLSWHEVEELVSDLIFKLDTPYDVILAITRGGVIPGGMIAEALKMKDVLTAAVLFPEDPSQRTKLSWPRFLQFPSDARCCRAAKSWSWTICGTRAARSWP